MNVRFVLRVVLLVASILVGAESAFSSAPEPSVPEFTVGFEVKSYEVPPAYSIDQYTGENVTVREAYRAENKSIVVTIKNQDFTWSSEDNTYTIFYNVRVKGHFGEEWKELYDKWVDDTLGDFQKICFPRQSNSEYTILSFSANDYRYGAQIDVQVEALAGRYSQELVNPFFAFGHYESIISTSSTSGWSDPQTITLNAPKICLVSPENRTYTEDSVNLNFTVDERLVWRGYSLDGQENVTINENAINLTELSNGPHTLTVYAEDQWRIMRKSETITFTVAKEPDQLNMILTGALILIPIALGLGLIIYLRKRK